MNRPRKREPKGTAALRKRAKRAPPAIDALEASGLAWWEFDVQNGRVRTSGLWSEMLGGEHMPVTASAKDLLALVPDGERPAMLAAFYATLKGEHEQYQFENRVRTRSRGGIKFSQNHSGPSRPAP